MNNSFDTPKLIMTVKLPLLLKSKMKAGKRWLELSD